MPKHFIVSSIFLFCSLNTIHARAGNTASPKEALIHVRLETELGNIDLELDQVKAPITSQNFVKYVKNHLYDGSAFYRSVTMENQPNNPIKIEVIQGGIIDEQIVPYPPIPLERTTLTGLRHFNGTISMGRREPDSATSQFFICINDQPELDFGGKRNPDGQGFAAFGRVVSGLDVVLKIQKSDKKDQELVPLIKIIKAYVLNN